MSISKSIFRNYDIRGVYPKDIDESTFLLIGKALGTDFSQRGVKTVVVGRDDRASSPKLTKSLIDGLLNTGRNITYIDISLTPVIHFLTCAKGFDAGIIVTASHNPKEFNGIRIDLKNAVPYYGEDIERLWEITNSGKFQTGKGIYNEENLSLDYINFIKSKFNYKKKHRIAIDCGSGASSFIAPKLFQEMGLNTVPVYCSYDSNFPKGVPDPENPIFLEELKKKVFQNKADIGVGFDTDGDRFGFVDEKGNSFPTDQTLILFAEDILRKYKGGKVIFDVKCSKLVEDLVRQFGGVPQMLRTGHPYFVKQTLKGEAILGAEYSGHVFFGDRYFGYDDGIYAACRVLELLDESDLTLSEIMSKYPKRFSVSEMKLHCLDEDKFEIIEKLKKYFEQEHKFKKVITIDGLRVEISDTGWFLIRASNTSPYISVRFEAESEKELKFIANEVLLLLSQYPQVQTDILKNFIG